MDLRTIGEKLEKGAYGGESREMFADDVRLVFENAIRFNTEPESPVRRDATELIEWFEKKWTFSGGGKKKAGPKKNEADANVCRRLLTKLGARPEAYHFNEPVDAVALNIPEYHKIIKKPMDFGTVREKLDAGAYGRFSLFAGDVRLVFSNAMRFNPKGTPIWEAAKELSEMFESLASGDPAPKKKVERVLEAAYDLDEALYFRQAVDPVALGIPEYLDVIKQPMSLDQMWAKVGGSYSPEELLSDARLVVANATKFNPANHEIHQQALKFGKAFEKLYREVFPPPPVKEEAADDDPVDRSKWRALVATLKEKPYAYFFLHPVDPVAMRLPDYNEIIKEPMDLGTIEKRMDSYPTVDAFGKDLRLVFRNAMLYNKNPKLAVHDAAKHYLRLADQTLAKLGAAAAAAPPIKLLSGSTTTKKKKKENSSPQKTEDKRRTTLVDVEDEPPPAKKKKINPEREENKARNHHHHHKPPLMMETLVVQKVSKVDPPRKKEDQPVRRADVPADPFEDVSIRDIIIIPDPPDEDPTIDLSKWSDLGPDSVETPPEEEDPLWLAARSEARAKRDREVTNKRRKAQQLEDARKLEDQRRQHHLEEYERRRAADAAAERQKLKDERETRREEELRRKEAREQARRQRANLGPTLDLDRGRAAITDLLDHLDD
ncbi:hypothetical protein CTAYLR_005977 [Chrysophaeum taylorii]|uniref:Bromo domain-containing protein n=1 Tax=Chrysophaeum taylorii TaxID=2483200 RepID=A0AAD7UIU5_9STRA|nr:hypothetical protein CTAYLR_005977 [Chrysophaeum taylorii]